MKYFTIAMALFAITQTQSVFAAEGSATLPDCYFNSEAKCWQSNGGGKQPAKVQAQQQQQNVGAVEVLHKSQDSARAYCEGYYSGSYSWINGGWVLTGYVCNEVINGAGG